VALDPSWQIRFELGAEILRQLGMTEHGIEFR
jgi:hypothetical protein